MHAYAKKSSGSGARKKQRVSGSGSTSSGNPFSDEDEESTLHKRRSAPATVQLEHSVASYFANQVESDETKARKLAIAESAAWTAERQSVAREAESKAMLKMLSAQTDAATAKTQRKAEEARLRAEESKAKIARKTEEANARAAESEEEAVHASNGGDDGEACGEALVDRFTVKHSFHRYNHTVMATSTASCVKITRHAGCVFCLVLSK